MRGTFIEARSWRESACRASQAANLLAVLRRRFWMTTSVVCLSAATWFGTKSLVPDARVMAAQKRPAWVAERATSYDGQPTLESEERAHAFRVPSGDPPALTCDAAKMIIAQVRKNLAYTPEPVLARAFAASTGDWLDPYGLWTVAPDAPFAAALEKRGADLVADLEARGSTDCASARELGRALASWVGELRALYDKEHAQPVQDDLRAASDPVFEGATVTRPARALASLLAQRVHASERGLGAAAQTFGATARARYFPTLDEEGWGRVVLAAAVRAYVPMVDPHGAWAPMDEEASVYEVDLEARPPGRLWDRSSRTALGLRIDSGAAAPLKTGDVILSLAGVPMAGMPLEQMDQLGYAASESKVPAQVIVVRQGERSSRMLVLARERGADADADAERQSSSDAKALEPASQDSESNVPPASADDLVVERIAFGNGDVIVVPIKDVRDDLGDALTRALLRERERDGRPLAGVVLDLRGNGGGSTDGAIDALGLFLPGAPLFPMKRRDGSLETDRAPEPPNVDRWTGPVATLVDGDTASAAEMIAGGLASYRRGPIVGTNTFGKGCAQEYLDDAARAGVLRLTTLLYALPDGSPVQRIGLTPTIKLSFASPTSGGSGSGLARDREALLPHAPPSWRGPDVRDKVLMSRGNDEGGWIGAWPSHEGSVGPCKDADVCRALRALGSSGANAPHKRVAKSPATASP
jgi:carboxyl-terminal processing protease